jgi:hypothetical protein
MIRMLPKNNRVRRGIIAVFVALCLVALVGMAAISVDGGLLYLEQRRAQAGADAAAMAAACDLFENYPSNGGQDKGHTAQSAALACAAGNGYTNDKTTSDIDVDIPPKSGPYAGLYGYAEVNLTYYMPRGFSGVFGSAPIPIHVRAVSRGAWVAPNAGVLVLNLSGKGTFNGQGNGAFTESGGPVIVNSNNPSAVLDTGNATTYAPTFDITGGVQLGGGSAFQTTPTPGQIYTGTHPTPDPLAYLPPPSMPPPGTMTQISIGSGNFQYTLSPGTYSNLPNFNSGDVVIFQQASAGNGGVFYINGGGFHSTGASLIMDPTTSGGIMIYNEPASTSTSEMIKITGNSSGTVNLGPLTNGPYAGIVLWEDRNSSVPVEVDGNGNFSILGTFYVAGALLTISGNGATQTGFTDSLGNFVPTGSSSHIGSQYISLDLSLTGNANIGINYSGPDRARTRIITLVE